MRRKALEKKAVDSLNYQGKEFVFAAISSGGAFEGSGARDSHSLRCALGRLI